MSRDDQSIFEDEGAGYLVSVSDIMAGLLFIFIITLVSFVIHFQQASERITNNKKVRDELLTRIEQQLTGRGLQVKIDKELGVLRLTEQAVRFRTNSWELDEQPQKNLDIIAEVLSELLPCYATTSSIPTDCDGD
ncbi:MAG: hypothetical protein CMK46_04490 [Porticoccus sp.]|nr:hypothetical protein [Porticoccus sp.]